MPGPLLVQSAAVMCAHAAKAQALLPSARVQAGGAPIVTLSSPYLVAGCPFVVAGAPLPCMTASFVMGAVRVTSMGQPVLLQDSLAIATPTGMPLSIVSTQVRAQGQ